MDIPDKPECVPDFYGAEPKKISLPTTACYLTGRAGAVSNFPDRDGMPAVRAPEGS